MKFNKKNVIVFGAGESGEGALSLLSRLGAKAYIYDDDETKARALALSTGASLVDGNGIKEILAKCSIAVLSPGISTESKCVVMAEALGIRVLSELELASMVSRAKSITVTGTNGKSSTVRMITSVLCGCGKYALSCGNIGTAYSRFADKLSEEDYAVVEASSFQLEASKEYHTDIAVILNVTSDHIDRHKSKAGYENAKSNIFKNSKEGDIVVINQDDQTVRKIAERIGENVSVYAFSRKEIVKKGVYISGDEIAYSDGNITRVICKVSDIVNHTHVENVLACLTVACILDLPISSAIKKIREFAPLAHTMERVTSRNGVTYVNDSKGTNVSATLHAVDSVNGKLVLILGGREKGEDYGVLFEKLPDRVENLVFFGENADSLKGVASDYGKEGTIANSMQSAVRIATEMLRGEGTVLFSPACASFDNYKNYKERGEAFVFAVNSYEW